MVPHNAARTGAKTGAWQDGYGQTGRMIRPFLLGSLVLLTACQPGLPEAPSRRDLSAELVRPRNDGPPPGPAGACWQADIKPAVIETVTEQVLATPEIRGPDGAVTTPAVFRTETSQSIVEARETVWFRSPCPAQMTPDFIATLQRALKARGFYLLPLTGNTDAPTRDAIRRFQSARGLDSDHLSLAAARELGIIAADIETLK